MDEALKELIALVAPEKRSQLRSWYDKFITKLSGERRICGMELIYANSADLRSIAKSEMARQLANHLVETFSSTETRGEDPFAPGITLRYEFYIVRDTKKGDL